MAKVLILATNYGTWGEELQAQESTKNDAKDISNHK